MSDLHGLAKRAGKRVSDFDPRALARGARVELEHTRSLAVARRIAMDHLTEDPRYYEKLARMEGGKGRRRSARSPSGGASLRGTPTRRFIVKISNSPRYKGEYSGGATLAEAVTEARTFKATVGPRAKIQVGYFTFGKSDPEDGRFHVSRTVQQGETSWL